MEEYFRRSVVEGVMWGVSEECRIRSNVEEYLRRSVVEGVMWRSILGGVSWKE